MMNIYLIVFFLYMCLFLFCKLLSFFILLLLLLLLLLFSFAVVVFFTHARVFFVIIIVYQWNRVMEYSFKREVAAAAREYCAQVQCFQNQSR